METFISSVMGFWPMEWSETASQNTSKPSLYLVAVEGLSGGVGLAGALVRPDI